MKQTLRKAAALLVLGIAAGFGARAQTYCTPVNNGVCGQQIISHFEIEGTTLVNPSYCTEGAKYVNYAPSGSTTAILTPGSAYTLKLGSNGNGNPAQMGLWIDYNQNGTFETTEFTFLTASMPSPGGTAPGPLTSVSITIPSGATPGPTRLRLRSNWESSPTITATDACSTLDYGETEDYTITLGTLSPCSGTPAAGITSSVTNTCGDPFNLSASPTGLSGVTYLFQKSTDGGTIWTDLAPASTSSFYTVVSQTVTTQYRVKVTCSGGGTGTSTVVTVTQNPILSCFCTPTTTGGTSYYISNFTTTDAAVNINKSSTGSSTGYQDFHASDTMKVYQGTTVNYSMSVSSGSYGRAIWIDYNENGTFEPTEQIAASTTYETSPLIGTFTIPYGATAGVKRMRILAAYTPSNPSNPCSNSGNGEYEDYSVQVIALTACTGTPSAGITASVTTVCAGIPFTLNATPIGLSGLTYQFQVSTDGGTIYTNLGTATATPNYTVPSQLVASRYRVIVACAGGGTNTSSAVIVAQSPGTSCYCTPVYTYDCSSGDLLDGFTLVGEGSSISHTGTGCSPGGYADYTTMSVNLFQGFNYPGTITTTYSGTYEDYRIWIDFNDNGLFESSESLAYGTGIGSSAPGSFTLNIPPTAPTGSHRMRARLVYSSGDASSIDPCASEYYGEAHDYTVNIIAPAPCAGTPSAALTSSASTACVGVPFVLTATPNGMTGFTYQFQKNEGSGWVALGTAGPSYTYAIPSQSVTTQYRVIVTCTSPGGGSNTSAAITVTQNPPSACYCIPTTGGGTSYNITNFTTTGGSININKTSSGTTMYEDFHTTDSAKAVPGTSIGYSMSVTSGSYGRAIWIDFNENGVFESAEQVASSTSYVVSPLTGTFTIPLTATPGVKRMRILAAYTPSNPSNPCVNSGTGQYEDYNFIVAVPAPCSGTPVAGTISMPLPKTYCVDAPAKTLTLSGYTAGVTGITIQWQNSTDGVTFTDITGATGPTYTTPTGTATKYYRAKVTCGGSGTSVFSSADTIKVTNPTPVAAPSSATICSGSTTAVALSSATPGVTFSWSAPTITGGTVSGADSGSGTSINQTLINTGTTPATVTYTVTGSIGSSAMMVYTYEGVSGAVPTPAQCAGWDAFRATLLPGYTYNYVNLKGTFDMTGRTVTDPVVATQIANALRDGVAGTFTSGGYTWQVGLGCGDGCGGGVVELSANGDACSCTSPGYTIRPNLINENWGGVNSASCGGPSQTIYVTVGYDGICTATTTVTITVDPVAPITTEPVATTACEGQPFTLSVTAPTGTSYQWYHDGAAITGATSASYNVPSASLPNDGNYYVLVNGCTYSDTVFVAVGAPMEVNIGADTTICVGDNIMLNAGNPGATYMWSTGDNTQTIVVNSPGTYTVSVMNSACTAMDTITVSEIAMPVAGTITTAGTMPTFSFTSGGTTGAMSLSWLFGDGGSAAGPVATHTYTANGTYTVMFIATNECGVSDTTTTEVTVTGLGIDYTQGKASGVQVYPNPSSGLTVIEAKGAVITSIEVVDNLGRVIMHTQPHATKTVIDVNGMAKGIYTLRIQTDKGANTTKLVVSDK